MKTLNNIRDLRNGIGQIDRNIFDLLDKRFFFCKEIGQLKYLSRINSIEESQISVGMKVYKILKSCLTIYSLEGYIKALKALQEICGEGKE